MTVSEIFHFFGEVGNFVVKAIFFLKSPPCPACFIYCTCTCFPILNKGAKINFLKEILPEWNYNISNFAEKSVLTLIPVWALHSFDIYVYMCVYILVYISAAFRLPPLKGFWQETVSKLIRNLQRGDLSDDTLWK